MLARRSPERRGDECHERQGSESARLSIFSKYSAPEESVHIAKGLAACGSSGSGSPGGDTGRDSGSGGDGEGDIAVSRTLLVASGCHLRVSCAPLDEANTFRVNDLDGERRRVE